MVSPDVLDVTSGHPLATEQFLQASDDVLLGEEASSSPCLRSLITSVFCAVFIQMSLLT